MFSKGIPRVPYIRDFVRGIFRLMIEQVVVKAVND